MHMVLSVPSFLSSLLIVLLVVLLRDLFLIVYFVMIVVIVWRGRVFPAAILPAKLELDGASCRLVTYSVSLYLVPPVWVVICLSSPYGVGPIPCLVFYVILTCVIKAWDSYEISVVLITDAKCRVVAKLSSRI
jgi:uncharacterized membrane protein